MGFEYGYVGWYSADVLLMIITVGILLYLKNKLTPSPKRKTTQQIFHLHNLTLEAGETLDLIVKRNGTVNASGCIGKYIPGANNVKVLEKTEDLIKLDVDGIAELTIIHRLHNTTDIYSIQWKHKDIPDVKDELEDSFSFLDYHWYGIGHFFHQYWPLEKCKGSGALVTGESGPFMNDLFGGIQERVVFCSSGVGIAMNINEPIFIDINSKSRGQLNIKASGKSPYHKRPQNKRTFTYEIFHSENVRTLWSDMRACLFSCPTDIPNESLFTHPIWCTWAEYKKNIDQQKVLEFAKSIRENNFKYSLLGIDDDWTPHYGDLQFSDKFPDPTLMIQELKGMDFKVSLWIHPYVSLYSRAFREGWKKGYLVNGIFGLPGIYSWWDGYAGLIDFTNPEATTWYLDKIKYLKERYGVDTFKLDAGEGYQLAPPTNKTKLTLEYPNKFTSLYVNLAAKCDTEIRAQETRVGSSNQDLPMFFRLQDKESNWGYFSGLKTVIPHVLTQGLLGYPFVLPDMIGGNAYAIFGGSTYPERELYIRWLQLNALLPAMQISIPPWKYDRDVVTIAQHMCQLHEEYSPTIIALAKEATKTGDPIIRPLWWISPEDPVALTIDSEFLLGDDLLVAPVLDQGATSRDIYLPKGKWRDENSGVDIDGGIWYMDYKAKLNELPYFRKLA